MIQRNVSDRRPARARVSSTWLAALLAVACVGPAIAPAAAARELPQGAERSAGIERRPDVPREAVEPGLLGPADGQPSAHYRQALAHAGETFTFEPGDRVSVPFRPRADDVWEIDGAPAQALPAGHATGRQLRAAEPDAIWAAGTPDDVVQRAATELASLDQGSAAAIPATLTSTASDDAAGAASAGAGIGATAVVGPGGLRREVFGFLPYWELADRSTVLDWRTLSTVAYFSVGCTAGGGLWKRNLDGSVATGWAGWTSSRMTSVINRAHRHGARVVLAVSCFAWSGSGAATQARLLGSPSARRTLARQVAAAVRDRGADGVNLDFEPIVAGYGDEFTALVRAVRRELNAIGPGYQLTFDAGATVGNQPIAAATARGAADAVLIMGYDYRTESSSVAGSISPLGGTGYDLTETVRAFTSRTAPSKVILGVPYYGRAWSTASDDLHGRTRNPTRFGAVAEPHYHHAVALAAAYGRRYDRVEQAPWTAYRREYCTTSFGCVRTWRQLYYDDATSLGLRYDLVNRSGLRGVGIWALGYDGSSPALRTALVDKFLADRSAPLVSLEKLPQRTRRDHFRVAWSGRDVSRIRRYDVQVSTGHGPFVPWRTGTTATSSTFAGKSGRTYAFRVRAIDVHGNASPWTSAGSRSVPRSLAAGGFGRVIVPGLKLRAAPSTAASIRTALHVGDALQVIGAPVVRQGYTWFPVGGPIQRWGPAGAVTQRGWVAAYGNGVTQLIPRRPIYATRVAVP